MTYTQFLETTISLSVQVALAVAVTYWLGRAARTEHVRSVLWTTCYVSLLALTVTAFILPHFRMIHPWQNIDSMVAVELASIETQLGKYLLIFWLLGSLSTGVFLVVRSFLVTRFLKQCRPLDHDLVEQLTTGFSDSHLTNDKTNGPKYLTNSTISSPFCWQMHRSYVVLPEFVLDFNLDEIQFVIRHELEHLRTGHPMQLFLQQLVEVLFWYHPMVWWASRQSTLSREFACDEAAVESSMDVVGYLKTLLRIVERGAMENSSPTPLAFGNNASLIARRAHRMTKLTRKNGRPQILGDGKIAVRPILILLMCLIGFFWLPMNILGSPRAYWSPWPRWSAQFLQNVGVYARDYETYDRRSRRHELMEHWPRETSEASSSRAESAVPHH